MLYRFLCDCVGVWVKEDRLVIDMSEGSFLSSEILLCDALPI